MRTAVVALGLLATLVPFVCGNSFKEFSDTDAAWYISFLCPCLSLSLSPQTLWARFVTGL